VTEPVEVKKGKVLTRVLVLEDDQLFNETLEDFLEEEGYTIECALDPYSALELTYKHVFDLYLFDVNLPYENGFDLLKKLRQSGDVTPAIFLTSRDDKESLTQGFSMGADDYMKKPIDFDELLLRIQAVLRRQIRKERVNIGKYSLDTVAKILYLEDEALDVTQKAIELLAKKITEDTAAIDALQYTQAALNLAHVRTVINNPYD